MNNTLKTLVGLALVAVVLVVGVSFPTTEVVKGPQGEQGVKGPKGDKGDAGAPGKNGLNGKDGKDALSLGAVTGPDFFYPYFGLNKVELFAESKEFSQGTSTICSFLSPNATSTLLFATIQLRTATTTDLQIGFGRGANKNDFSTTTFFDKSATTTATLDFANNGTGGPDDFLHSAFASTGVDSVDVNNRFFAQRNLESVIVLPNERITWHAISEVIDGGESALDGFNLDGTCEVGFKPFK